MSSSLAKPITVLAFSCAFTAASVAYVHWAQVNDQETMKQNVLRDIAIEKLNERKANGGTNSADNCETGLCDLKQSRIKDE
mmetsp:Transcript_11731/g.13498  ORF Transcript_11731/g.13498 Transcript_11731/m.13498 type:complete len:81 (+) Transcript_11731:164-406(+)